MAPQLLALAAALGYAMASISIKRALMAGVPAYRVNLVCNLMLAVLFQSLWLLGSETEWDPGQIWRPAVAGTLFFGGQIFTFLALSRGDVSVTTPLLGSKVLFIVVFLTLAGGTPLPGQWWLAAALCSFGIFLVTWEPRQERSPKSRQRIGAILALISAGFFGLTDTLFQLWSPSLPLTIFIPVMFGSTGLWTLLAHATQTRSKTQPGRDGQNAKGSTWLWVGGFLLAGQALIMAFAIGLSGDAAGTNIIYGSRAILSVLMIAFLGHWLKMEEMGKGKGSAARRFIGSIFVFSAVVIVLIN